MEPTRVVVDSRLRLDPRGLPEAAWRELREAFEHKNSKRKALEAMGLPHWNEPAVIKTWQLDAQVPWASFPRGGLGRLRDALRRYGVPWVVEDRRSEGAADLRGGIPEFRPTPWPHQEEMVHAATEQQNCLVRAPTGSGKTGAGLLLASRLQLPTLVIVNVVSLFDQWVARAQKDLGMRDRDVGVIRGKRREVRPLTIAMQKTLDVHGVDDELADAFGLLIFDEVQLASAPTYFQVVDPFRAKYRVGVSADERRKDKKEFLTYDLFGDVACDVSRSELEDDGYVLDVEVRVVPTEFDAPWYGVPDEDAPEGEQQELDATRLAEEMAQDAARNALVVRCVEEELAEGQQVVVMGRLREHCREIDSQLVARGVTSGFLIGGADYKQEFDRTRALLEGGKVRVGVGTVQAVGVGIDLPAVGRLVCMLPLAANRQQFGQVRGRACRAPKGKKDARMYYLWDKKIFGLKHVQNLVRWNRRVAVREADGTWTGGREYLKRARAVFSAA